MNEIGPEEKQERGTRKAHHSHGKQIDPNKDFSFKVDGDSTPLGLAHDGHVTLAAVKTT